MVGVFFLAIVVAIVMRTIKKQNENLKNILAEAEIINYTNKLKTYLSSPENCGATFGGLDFENSTVDAIKTIKDGLATNRYEVYTKSKKTIGTQNIRVMEYKLTKFDQEDNEISDLGFIYLNIKLDKNLDSLSASKAKRRIRLYYKAEGKLITQCAFGGLPTDSSLIVDKGTYNYINSPSVSINTQTPSSTLNIDGVISLEDTELACDLEQRGSIKYNSKLKRFEACVTPPNWTEVHK
jgi:hypothetical protein